MKEKCVIFCFIKGFFKFIGGRLTFLQWLQLFLNSNIAKTCYKKHLPMKKVKIDVCFFGRIVMPLIMFIIPSVACCKLPSPSFWIAKRCTLSRRGNASLKRKGSILIFVYAPEISFASKLQHKSMCYRKNNWSWNCIWTRNSCWIYVLYQCESY